jgi:cell division protease FtsH
MAMTDEEKKYTAWHEAGHALVNVMLKHTHPLHKVTIIPRGQALGVTMSLPEEDMLNRRRKEMLDIIAVTMAGRIAEEIVSGDISSGAAMDIQQATHLARAMVCQWGMSDKVGMVQYGSDHAAAAQAPRWNADGRAGRHAVAGNTTQTRAAQIAGLGNAGARAGLKS